MGFNKYIDAERKSGVDKAEIAFKAIDRDNSGFITMAELGKLGTKMNQKKTEALMAKLDADGDGKITLEEFRELFKHKYIERARKRLCINVKNFLYPTLVSKMSVHVKQNLEWAFRGLFK